MRNGLEMMDAGEGGNMIRNEKAKLRAPSRDYAGEEQAMAEETKGN